MTAPHPRIEQLSDDLLYVLVVLLAAALPFEFLQPVISRRWFEFTNLDLILAAAALVWSIRVCILASSCCAFAVVPHPASGGQGRPPLRGRILHQELARQGPGRWSTFDWHWYSPFIWPALVFLLLATLSALLAHDDQLAALRSVARFATGVYAFFLTIQVSSSRKRLGGLLWAIVAGAGLSAALGLGQMAGLSSLDQFLTLFAEKQTLAGGDLRLSATFGHANIAAAFFEMAVPLTLALTATSLSKVARFAAAFIAITSSLAVVLTMSRAAMATLAIFFGLVLTLGWRRLQWRTILLPTLGATGGLAAVIAVLLLTSTTFVMRLTTMSDVNWYNAGYGAPSALMVHDLDGVTAEIEVRNTGSLVWKATGDRSFALGYRWLSEDGLWVLGLPHGEVSLPRDVGPGESAELAVSLQVVLPPGNYRLAWGMLQRDTVWFHYRDVPDAETAVHIVSDIKAPDSLPALLPATSRDDPQRKSLLLSRTELWRAALRMLADSPLLGVGPGNFRHLYGRYLGLANWNHYIHAHNLYLELLADLGLVGAASFGWFLLLIVIRLARILNTPGTGPTLLWAIGLAGSVIAFLFHGLFDYFLGFASLHFLYWMVLGLIVALARLHQQPALPQTRSFTH